MAAMFWLLWIVMVVSSEILTAEFQLTGSSAAGLQTIFCPQPAEKPPFSQQKNVISAKQRAFRIVTGSTDKTINITSVRTIFGTDMTVNDSETAKCCFFASFYCSDDFVRFCELDFTGKTSCEFHLANRVA
ncbi:hypothetical protein [Gimesia panareensis]|uniref:hypothetical protein n=1 Tax=Gimesia panareensis TaxID=2527978 RepID=UPI0011A2CE88|nr:hypothetical protein [Gimesia panareensis]